MPRLTGWMVPGCETNKRRTLMLSSARINTFRLSSRLELVHANVVTPSGSIVHIRETENRSSSSVAHWIDIGRNGWDNAETISHISRQISYWLREDKEEKNFLSHRYEQPQIEAEEESNSVQKTNGAGVCVQFDKTPAINGCELKCFNKDQNGLCCEVGLRCTDSQTTQVSQGSTGTVKVAKRKVYASTRGVVLETVRVDARQRMKSRRSVYPRCEGGKEIIMNWSDSNLKMKSTGFRTVLDDLKPVLRRRHDGYLVLYLRKR
ncbi:hypothetical protein CBL_12351 [Carabus blaptoides fortunei]